MIEDFLISNADTGLIGAICIWSLMKTGGQIDKFIEEISSFKEVVRTSNAITDRCLTLLETIEANKNL